MSKLPFIIHEVYRTDYEKTINFCLECAAPSPETEQSFIEGFLEAHSHIGALESGIERRSDDSKQWRLVVKFSNDAEGRANSAKYEKMMNGILKSATAAGKA